MVTKILDKDKREARLLTLILNWNIIIGLCNILSEYRYLGFLALVGQYSVVASAIFVTLSLVDLALYKNVKISTFTSLIWIPFVMASFLLEPQIEILLPRASIYYALNVLCVSVLLCKIDDFNYLIECIKKYVFLAVIYSIVQLISNSNSYSMFYSYAIAVPSMFCLTRIIRGEKKEKLYIIPFALFLFVNIKSGSRGTILCYVLLLILDLLCFSKNKKKIRYTIIICAIVGLTLAFWDQIITAMINIFPDSRNIRLLANGLALYDSGRADYYDRLISELLNNPLAIRGLYSDRLLITNYSDNLEILWGSYAHNIFLEMIFQLGVLGIILAGILLVGSYRLIKFMKRESEESLKTFVEITLAFSYGQLMVSSSYLIAPSFGALLGLLILFRQRKVGLSI